MNTDLPSPRPYEELLAMLTEEHPHHCEECLGVGGVLKLDNRFTRWGEHWDAPCHDLEECYACEGKHPMDTTRPMTEEEYEEWVRAIVISGNYPHPLHAELLAPQR